MPKRNARRLMLPLALSLSLIGCATSLPKEIATAPPQIPPPAPELMEPPDLSATYSDVVQKLLQTWLELLTSWKRGS